MIVDFHMHYSPREDVEPRLVEGADTVLSYRDGVPSYTHHEGLYRLDRHIEHMDGAGIDLGLLSSGVGMAGDLETCRRVNDALQEAQVTYPGRFRGLAHAPAFGGTASADELARCKDQYGFPGAVVTSSIGGRVLNDPELDPFWAAVQELDLFVFVHPSLGEPAIGLQAFDELDLYRCVGREFDLVLATTRLILGGVFDRFPALQVVMSHLGGGFGAVLDRVRGYQDKELMGVADDPRHGVKPRRDVDHYIENNLYFDTGGFYGSLPAIRAGLATLPSSRIVFGSDYPQEIRTAKALARFTSELRGSEIDEAIVRGIESENGKGLVS